MNEFIDIHGFEGLYQMNILGDIKRMRRVVGKKVYDEKILKHKVSSHGYFTIELYKGGRKNKKGISIHRLIAIHFIPNPQKLPCVNHKNGIKTDNRIENLEWCTYSYNNKHAYETGLKQPIRGSKNAFYKKSLPLNKLFSENGVNGNTTKIILDQETGIYYFGAKQAAEAKGMKIWSLGDKLRGTKFNDTRLIYV